MTARNGEEIDWVVEEEDVLACKERWGHEDYSLERLWDKEM